MVRSVGSFLVPIFSFGLVGWLLLLMIRLFFFFAMSPNELFPCFPTVSMHQGSAIEAASAGSATRTTVAGAGAATSPAVAVAAAVGRACATPSRKVIFLSHYCPPRLR